MKRKIAIATLVLCLTGTTAFAGGSYGGYRGYHGRPHAYGHHGSHRHSDGLGIAVGVMGGLLLGSALLSPPAPPPPTIVYGPPPPPEVIVRQPRICVEERVVSGEWRINEYDGRQVWVPFPYPVSQRIEVPCY